MVAVVVAVLVVVVVEGDVLEVVEEGGVDVEVVVVPVVEVDAEVVLVVEVEVGTVEDVVVEGGRVDVVVVLEEGGTTTCALVVDVDPEFGGRLVEPEPEVSAKTSTAIATAATATASTMLTGNFLRRCVAPTGSVGSPGEPRAAGTDAMIEVRSMADGVKAPSAASELVAPVPSTGCCSVVSKSGDPPGWVGMPAVAPPTSLAAPPGSPPGAPGSPPEAPVSTVAAPVSTSSVCGPAGAVAPLGGGVSFGSSRSAEVPGSP